MKVFLFGAGASEKARYPLTSGLLAKLKSNAHAMAFGKDWKKRECLRDYLLKQPGRLQFMINSKNPEVFLSVLDLYEQARKEAEQTNTPSKFLKARDALLICLRSYFEKKHEMFCKDAPPDYLRKKLAGKPQRRGCGRHTQLGYHGRKNPARKIIVGRQRDYRIRLPSEAVFGHTAE